MNILRTLTSREIKANTALFEKAKRARMIAYAPYSGFKVGAAVEGETGKIYTGCNVENQSYGLTCCAERATIFKMVGKGEKIIHRVCVVLDGGAKAGGSPCGACRQVIWEFSGQKKKLEIILADPDGNMRLTNIGELLPDAFEFR
jgi:cytidine deaminase